MNLIGSSAARISPEGQQGIVACFDVGGSTIKYGALDLDGQSLSDLSVTREVPSHFHIGPEATLAAILQLVSSIEAQYGEKVVQIGLAAPGSCSLDGVIIESPNGGSPWDNCPFRKMVEEATRTKVTFENDANAAGLSAFQFAVEQGFLKITDDNGFIVTVGTGNGYGHIKDGKIYRGAHGEAGEGGHIQLATPRGLLKYNVPAKCSCGRKACAEAYTSLNYLDRELRYALTLPRFAKHPLQAVPDNEFDRAKKLLELAGRGDHLASALLAGQSYNLGIAIANVALIVDPSWILIGGGITNGTEEVKQKYLRCVQRAFRTQASRTQGERTTIGYAATGDNAGWLGVGFEAVRKLAQGEAA